MLFGIPVRTHHINMIVVARELVSKLGVRIEREANLPQRVFDLIEGRDLGFQVKKAVDIDSCSGWGKVGDSRMDLNHQSTNQRPR